MDPNSLKHSPIMNRQHKQTMNILNGMLHQSAERSHIAAAQSNQRAQNSRDDHSDEQHDDLIRTIGENNFLKAELAKRDEELLEQKDLVAYWANGNEAFRRTIQHLQTHWSPESPSEAPLKESIQPLINEKLSETVTDSEWPTIRAGKSESRLTKRRARHKTS